MKNLPDRTIDTVDHSEIAYIVDDAYGGAQENGYPVFFMLSYRENTRGLHHDAYVYLTAAEAETMALEILANLANQGKLSFKIGEGNDESD